MFRSNDRRDFRYSKAEKTSGSEKLCDVQVPWYSRVLFGVWRVVILIDGKEMVVHPLTAGRNGIIESSGEVKGRLRRQR